MNYKYILDNNKIVGFDLTGEDISSLVIDKIKLNEIEKNKENLNNYFRELLNSNDYFLLCKEKEEMRINKIFNNYYDMYLIDNNIEYRLNKLLFCLIELRVKRNIDIFNSDKYMLNDFQSILDDKSKNNLIAYRNTLRNITDNINSIDDYYNLVYPSFPEITYI